MDEKKSKLYHMLSVDHNFVLFNRAQMGEDPNDKKEIKEELSKSRRQMEDSRLRMTKLRGDGLELVTNIRVAGDARESSRRIEEEEARRQRLVLNYIVINLLLKTEQAGRWQRLVNNCD